MFEETDTKNGKDLAVVRQMARAVSSLLAGKTPEQQTFEEAQDPEVRLLADLVGRLIRCHVEAGAFITDLAEGRLDVQPPSGNALVSPLKRLHLHLKHLTWMTGRVPNGDLHQPVDDMGEILTPFNRMMEAPREKDRIEAALKTAGGVCHELNQPLMAASGYAELLLMDMAQDNPVRDKLMKIRESVERMIKITRKLTHITRYENRDDADGTKIPDIHRSADR